MRITWVISKLAILLKSARRFLPSEPSRRLSEAMVYVMRFVPVGILARHLCGVAATAPRRGVPSDEFAVEL